MWLSLLRFLYVDVLVFWEVTPDYYAHTSILTQTPILQSIPPPYTLHYSLLIQLIHSQLSLFVAALDATIVATAAPTISSDLSSAAGYTWIGAAYLLANAASGPIWAKLSDIWGRKPIMLVALAVFFASSAVCAAASSMKMLIVGRAVQGTAGGGLILLVHVAISDLFSLRYVFFFYFCLCLVKGFKE